MKNVEVALEVPSGKIVFDNNFVDLYPIKEEQFNVNETVGKKQTTEAFGRVGLLHGYVGNSCPSIYQNKNTISILNAAYSKKTYDSKPVPKKFGKRVGGICTDLWWYCAADHDDYVKRGGDTKHVSVVNVEPGRYILSHNLKYHDDNKLHVYATITRSDKPLKPWKMPEEGAAKAIMKLLPDRFKTVKVLDIPIPEDANQYQKDTWVSSGHNKHTIKTSLYVETAYKKPKKDDYLKPWKKIGYKVWGRLFDGNEECFIRHLIVNSKQVKDYKTLAKLVVDNFEEVLIATAEFEAVKNFDYKNATQEEKDEHRKKFDAAFKRLYPDHETMD